MSEGVSETHTHPPVALVVYYHIILKCVDRIIPEVYYRSSIPVLYPY